MGGVVSGIGDAIGDVVGGVGGIASGVAGAIPGIGPYIGPVVGGITGGPVGFATSLGSNALQGNYGGGGGGGGSSNVPKYAQPNYNYGNQTYQYGSNPVDASKYMISGDKGVYNLMPALGQISPKTLQSTNPMYTSSMASSANNKSYYTPYEAYNDLSAQMAKDPKALAAFQSMYQPTTPTAKGVSPYVDFGLGSSIGDNATYADIAKYASTNQNPFYIPFNASGGKTSAFIPPHVLEAQKKAEAKARFDAMSPEKQQQVIAQRQADFAGIMNKVDPNYILRNIIADRKQGNTPERQQQLINQREANRANVTPTPVRPTTPTPVRPTTPTPVRPTTPTPVAPTPVTPTPVTPPSYPGINTTPFRMAQGGITTLRRN